MVSRCFPGGYNVKLYISRGRLAWWFTGFFVLCLSPSIYQHHTGWLVWYSIKCEVEYRPLGIQQQENDVDSQCLGHVEVRNYWGLFVIWVCNAAFSPLKTSMFEFIRCSNQSCIAFSGLHTIGEDGFFHFSSWIHTLLMTVCHLMLRKRVPCRRYALF